MIFTRRELSATLAALFLLAPLLGPPKVTGEALAAGKDFLSPVTILAAGNMASATLTSATVNILGMDNIGVVFIFTGTPTGTFDIDVSLDQVTWTPLSFAAPLTASGTAGNIYVDLNQLSAAYIRARYTKVSGSGTLKILIDAKTV